jgi:hypothetical protein
VLTSCAGLTGKNFPTAHRMLACIDEISKKDDVDCIMPLLKLNSKQLILPKEKYLNLNCISKQAKDIIDKCRQEDGIKLKSFYCFEELTLWVRMKECGMSELERLTTLSMLRNVCNAETYNKVSDKTDEHVRKLLLEKGYCKSKT